MSADDRDFPYKLFGKRLAWSLGYLPFLNVPIRTPKTETPGQWLDATDVDVLGFNFSANGNISTLIADCKDTMGNGAERIFWVRGLADMLSSDKVFLLKKRIPDNAKTLSSKLNITPIDYDCIAFLQRSLNLDAFKGPYFDEDGYTALQSLYTSFPKESQYKAFVSFFNSQIWSLPFERRLISTIDFFNHKEFNKTLNPDDKSHQAIVLLGSLHLSISIAHVISNMKFPDLQNWEQRLREELFGGPTLFQQKQRFAQFVQKQTGDTQIDDSILDLPSFPMLFEISYRLFSKRHALNDAIRFIDIARHYHAISKPIPEWGKLHTHALSNKFAKDILSLFVRSNGINIKFSKLIDDIENTPITQDTPTSSTAILPDFKIYTPTNEEMSQKLTPAAPALFSETIITQQEEVMPPKTQKSIKNPKNPAKKNKS